jgi:hypothetical protein
MNWKIESRQKSVAGIGGHNYLALVDPKGNIHGEIHGHLGDNQRLVRVKGLANPEVEGAARPVFSGSEKELRGLWRRMEQDADELSGKSVYGLLSPNSNSFWGTVLRRAGFDPKDSQPDSSLRTPGTGVDLSNPLWWTPEHRWPGVPNPPVGEPSAIPAYRLP